MAANLLADAGWSVMVLEEAAEPGGAVRSGELVEPGFTNDLFSSFYPFTLASPHMQALELERWGVRWIASPVAVAHPPPTAPAPRSAATSSETAASLEECAPGDGDALARALRAVAPRPRRGALGAFFAPFPPVRPVLGLLATPRPA